MPQCDICKKVFISNRNYISHVNRKNPCVHKIVLKPNYDACYEWRKIVKHNALWSMLPNEMIELIARKCVEKTYMFVKKFKLPVNDPTTKVVITKRKN